MAPEKTKKYVIHTLSDCISSNRASLMGTIGVQKLKASYKVVCTNAEDNNSSQERFLKFLVKKEKEKDNAGKKWS